MTEQQKLQLVAIRHAQEIIADAVFNIQLEYETGSRLGEKIARVDSANLAIDRSLKLLEQQCSR